MYLGCVMLFFVGYDCTSELVLLGTIGASEVVFVVFDFVFVASSRWGGASRLPRGLRSAYVECGGSFRLLLRPRGFA